MLRSNGAAMAQLSNAIRDGCLQGLSSEWGLSTVLVPAVFREWGGLPLRAPRWLLEQAPVYLYQRLAPEKPCYSHNSGYECGIYLRFLNDYYDNLPAFIVFAQADWFAMHKGQAPHIFDFWQLRCLHQHGLRGNNSHIDQPEAHRGHAAWWHWMPLGIRHTIYPPYQIRSRGTDLFATSYTYRILPLCSGAHDLFVEWCWRELLALFAIQPHPPNGLLPQAVDQTYDTNSAPRRLRVTFYPAQNFIASRKWLRRHSRRTYVTAYERLILKGDCHAGGGIADGAWPELLDLASHAQQEMMVKLVNRTSPRPRNFNKIMVATSMEHLMHAIFGGHPVEGAPPMVFPSRNCSGFANTPPPVVGTSSKSPLGHPRRDAACNRTRH